MAMMQSTEACVKSACAAEEENGVDGEGGFLQFSFMLAHTHMHLEVMCGRLWTTSTRTPN